MVRSNTLVLRPPSPVTCPKSHGLSSLLPSDQGSRAPGIAHLGDAWRVIHDDSMWRMVALSGTGGYKYKGRIYWLWVRAAGYRPFDLPTDWWTSHSRGNPVPRHIGNPLRNLEAPMTGEAVRLFVP